MLDRTSWEDAKRDLRRYWADPANRTGRRWEGVEDAVRFGWESGYERPELAGKSWGEVEEDLRRTWEISRRGTASQPWDAVSDAVRQGWEHAAQQVRGSGTLGQR